MIRGRIARPGAYCRGMYGPYQSSVGSRRRLWQKPAPSLLGLMPWSRAIRPRGVISRPPVEYHIHRRNFKMRDTSRTVRLAVALLAAAIAVPHAARAAITPSQVLVVFN